MSKKNHSVPAPSAQSSPPVKIQTTKDEKIELLRYETQILMHQREAMNHVESGRQIEAIRNDRILEMAKGHGIDLNRYGMHFIEWDFWDKDLLAAQGQKPIPIIQAPPPAKDEKKDEVKPNGKDKDAEPTL